MTRSSKRGLVSFAAAAALAASGFAGPARADTTIPGLNGEIVFTSTRDFPFAVPPTSPLRGFDQPCGPDALSYDCALELYFMDPVPNGAATRLTNNTDGDDTAAWLPANGARVAFESDRAQIPEPDCKGCFNYDIWSMNYDGSGPTQLTSDPHGEFYPSYSPDGSHIAFEGQTPIPNPPGGLFSTAPDQILIMPSGGESAGTPVPLLPAGQTGLIENSETATTEVLDGAPTYSPDGSTIAFTRLTVGETFSPPPPAPAHRLAQTNFTFAQHTRCVLREERNFVQVVDGTFEVPASHS